MYVLTCTVCLYKTLMILVNLDFMFFHASSSLISLTHTHTHTDHPVCVGMQSTAGGINTDIMCPSPVHVAQAQKHRCTHTAHMYNTHQHTNRLTKHKRAHSCLQWGVTVKCKPSDYSLRRWEERGGGRSGGMLRRGQRRRKEGEKNTRAVNVHQAPLLSFGCQNKPLLIAAVISSITTPYFLFCCLTLLICFSFFILVLEEAIDILHIVFNICLFLF